MQKKVDIKKAQEFIDLFNYDVVTIQLLKGGRAYKTVCFPADDIDWGYLKKEHLKYNAEIFFMVNEGDTIIHKGKKTPRSIASVCKIKALFIDTDDAPINAVLAFLKDVGLKPHIAVETSPNKYHLYILLKESPELLRSDSRMKRFRQQVKAWKLCQEYLAKMGNAQVQCDKTMKDLSRILRIPGFCHLKDPDRPFLTKTKKVYQRKHCSLDETLAKLRPDPEHDSDPDSPEYTLDEQGYQPPSEKVTQGSRHHEMTAYLGYLLKLGVAPDVATQMFYPFALANFENGKSFLPKGKRNFEVTDFIKYKLEDIELQNTIESNNTAEELLKAKDDTDPLDLPDSFYLEAPGLIGEITREISRKALYPLPALAFASALSAVGTLKSSVYKTEFGHVPSNYFLCLAPTGSGKAYGQRTVSHTFNELNLQNMIMGGVRSEKGIARFLEENDSKGLIQLDESEDFFKTFSDQYAPSYLRACKDVLLQAYSAHDDPFKSMGRTGDKREKPIVLKYPRLNLIAYGVPELFRNAFNKSMVSDGLLQRFVIISTNAPRKKNPDYVSAESLSSNDSIFSALTEIVQKQRDFSENTFMAIQDLTAEYEASENAKDQEKLLSELNKLQQASFNKGQRIVTFSGRAKKLYEKFASDRDKLVNKENRSRSGLAGLYTRDAEKVGRLLVTSANHRIKEDELDYYVNFIRSRTDALKNLCENEFNKSEMSKDLEDLQMFIATNLNPDGVCTYRHILQYFHVRDSRKLKELLYDSVDSGLLTLHEKYRQGNSKGKTGKAYALQNLIS